MISQFHLNYLCFHYEIQFFFRVLFYPLLLAGIRSIKAVNDAYKADKLIGVISQKDSAVEEPTVSDLEEIGTVAKIVKLIKMPDGGTTIIIQGKKRFKVDEITTEDPYFKAKITVLEEEELKRR